MHRYSAHIAAVFTLEDFRRSAGVFDVLDAALQLPRCVFQCLPVFFADQLSDAAFVLLQQLLETKHHLSAFCSRRVTPGRKGCLG